MFDDHKNEEPGWREYWQSGGRKTEPKDKFPRIILYIALLLIIIYVAFYFIEKNIKVSNKINKFSYQPQTHEDLNDNENIVGKTVSNQLKNYLENIEPYQNSIAEIILNMKTNQKNNKTYIDTEIYEIYKNYYNLVKTPPVDLIEYKDIISEKIIRLDALIPEENNIIDIDDLNKIIDSYNSLKLVDVLSEFFEKYNYRYDHTTDERVRYWYKL